MRNLTDLIWANEQQAELAVKKILLMLNQNQILLKKEDFRLSGVYAEIYSTDEKVFRKLQELEKQGFIGGVRKREPEGKLSFYSWGLNKIINFNGLISEESKKEHFGKIEKNGALSDIFIEVKKMKLEEITEFSKKLFYILRYIINEDENSEILNEQDVYATQESVEVVIKHNKVRNELKREVWQRLVGSMVDMEDGRISIQELNIIEINNMVADLMPMDAMLSVLVKEKNIHLDFKNACYDNEKYKSFIRFEGDRWETMARIIEVLEQKQLDFDALVLTTSTINAITTEKTEGEFVSTYYQIDSSNKKFDPKLFQEYITREQLDNERKHFFQNNVLFFSLINYLLEICSRRALKGDLVKLILVLAAQHSLDAVFNVVLTMMLKLCRKNKIYKANVKWVKKQLFNSSVNLNFLLKLCDPKNGQLSQVLKQLSWVACKNISADQLFLCVPDDEAAELYAKTVLGAVTAFNPNSLIQLSTLVMLRFGTSSNEITVTYRFNGNNVFNMAHQTIDISENDVSYYEFLSMKKFSSWAEIVPESAMVTANTVSDNMVDKDLKRKFEQVNLDGNKKQKTTEESQANTDSQNPFDSLPDETLVNIFRFFNPREKLVVSGVCKRFNRISHDRRLAEAQYKQYKIVHRSLDFMSIKELKKAAIRLQKAVEETMQELNSLPHWYGDINNKQAEIILNQFPDYSYLLHNAHDVEGAITLSAKSVVSKDLLPLNNPMVKMEGALILSKISKNIPLPEHHYEPGSSSFQHYLIRMIEGYDDKLYFMVGCFQSMRGHSSLRELLESFEQQYAGKFTPACIQVLSVSRSPQI